MLKHCITTAVISPGRTKNLVRDDNNSTDYIWLKGLDLLLYATLKQKNFTFYL